MRSPPRSAALACGPVTYETIARLGRGGMGVVDLARGPEGNKVALKRLTLTGSANDIIRARQRLLREAEVLRRLHHPNVVRLIDVIDEGDEIVLVMPYLAGGSLAERVAQHGPAPADEVERQARRLFGALAQAHQLGIIHRDIKPANILFDDRGEPCLADFGVAQTWDQTHGLTVSGMVVGTPGFMAPEQARGEQALPASDVFSLGATLLFAATGDGPFGAGDPALLMVKAAGNKVEKVPRTLPSSLRHLLSDTLQARPERRPSAASVVGANHGFMAALPSVPRPRSGVSWAIVLGVLAAVVVAVLAIVAVTGSDGDEEGPNPLEPAEVPGDDTVAPGVAEGAPGSDCQAQPYQPCGEEPRPNTDGTSCVSGYADYDGDPANGCEAGSAEPEDDTVALDGTAEGWIVPSDDTDRFTLAVSGGGAGCEPLVVMLEAPPGMGLRLDVAVGNTGIGSVDVPGGEANVVRIEDPCAAAAKEQAEPSTPFEASVRPIGEQRVGDPYVLRLMVDEAAAPTTTTTTA
jgi:hypothetical protein